MRQNSVQEKHSDETFQSRRVHRSSSKWTLWISNAIVFFTDYSLICSRSAKLNKVHCVTIYSVASSFFFLLLSLKNGEGWVSISPQTPTPASVILRWVQLDWWGQEGETLEKQSWPGYAYSALNGVVWWSTYHIKTQTHTCAAAASTPATSHKSSFMVYA